MDLTYKGRTQNANQWIKELGLSKGALYARLKRGWTVEEAIETPVDMTFSSTGTVKFPTKSEAELKLNETPIEQWPKGLVKFVKDSKAKKKGEYVRTHYRKQFDDWFTKNVRNS